MIGYGVCYNSSIMAKDYAVPKVSIIIPIYNTQDYLRECLDSVCSQTLKELEIICIDDGSTDSSFSILEEYKKRDSRIHTKKQKHSNAGAARNAGMEIAKGDYLYFLDSDDYIEQNALETMVGIAKTNDVDIVVCRSKSYDNTNGEVKQIENTIRYFETGALYAHVDIKENDVFGDFMGWPWDKLFRRDFIIASNLKFQSIESTNDALFTFIALAVANKIFIIEDALVYHRIGNLNSIENNSRHKRWQNLFEATRAIEKELKTRDLFAAYEKSFRTWLVTMSMWNIYTLPKKVLDDFIAAVKTNVIDNVDLEKREVPLEDWARDKLKAIEQTHGELLISYFALQAKQDESTATIRQLHKEMKRMRSELLELKNEKSSLHKRLDDVYASKSWKITKPLRHVGKIVKRK